MDITTVLSLFTIIFLASFVQGITGFGYAVISAPLIVQFLSKETMVTTYTILSVVLNGLLFSQIKSKVAYRKIIPFLIGSIIGLPIGLLVLKLIDQHLLTQVVGLFSIIMIPFIIFKHTLRLPSDLATAAITGVITGILQTSATVNGPLAVTYLTNTESRQNVIRRTLAGFFFVLAVFSLYILTFSGLATINGVYYSLICIPGAAIGASLGNISANKIPVSIATILTVGIIIAGGLSAILS